MTVCVSSDHSGGVDQRLQCAPLAEVDELSPGDDCLDKLKWMTIFSPGPGIVNRTSTFLGRARKTKRTNKCVVHAKIP